ncbi:hypothetical protein [Enterococcus faecalis]|uniref:hypothetical protein n=1 Tax=Enterococcus faecalis TaxID=1351 RepID=UPI000330E269|nr:hypothetical protein [Enterococcus faecalis]EGO2667231.1 hypothetical protein [Enterococcus faecalis]EGO5911069.1 hypothetical protein [Enterococcus faecalis]EGO6065619.1 hypothetical protein [Enterococcus faecalis]EGO8774285.1 hypothetical protein [Enterococcus faecalis]EHS7936736.1 hypothetical protein [Enterococcus faecalis]
MKITIEGTPEEIAKMLQAIGNSEKQKNINVDLQCGVNKISEELARRITTRQEKIEKILSRVKQNQNGR